MKKIIIAAILVTGAIGGFFIAGKPADNSSPPGNGGDDYISVASGLKDAHGLAVDVGDSSKVWIASHSGLHLLKDDKELFIVGSKRDDYMGFSPHPTEPNTFYTSGHPTGGGNLGLQKTTDGGRSWQKVADGVNGPVDFHAMTISPTDPSLMYGAYRNKLQRSTNGGRDWAVVANNIQEAQLISLAADPSFKSTLYAATDAGLLVSQDQGQAWGQVSDSLQADVITAISINPKNNQELLVFGQASGLVKSTDGGKNWTKIETPLVDSPVLFISHDHNNPSTIYAINQSLAIYKSVDNAVSWNKIR